MLLWINSSKSKLGIGCYGAVAVCGDQIIDSFYRISSRSTNNSCEIKGLRAAILLANKWKGQFSFINIFSDSQISVFGLKDYIYKWKYNPKDEKLYNSNEETTTRIEIRITEEIYTTNFIFSFVYISKE